MKPEQNSEMQTPSLLKEFVSMAIVVTGLGLLGYAFLRHLRSTAHEETPLIVDVKTTTGTQMDLCGAVALDGRPTLVEMLYSSDKQAWLEDVAQSFSKLCPNIQIKLHAMGDIESADAIMAQEQKPTLWAPADDLVVRYLDARWRKEKPNNKPLFDVAEQTSIAASPMVLVMWRNRHDVLRRILAARPSDYGPWVTAACAQVPIDANLDGMAISDMVPGTWIDWYNPVKPPRPEPKKKAAKPVEPPPIAPEDMPLEYKAPFPSLAQITSWGRVKIGHTSPTRSAAGLEALYLMAYDYSLPRSRRAAESTKKFEHARNDPSNRGKVVAMDWAQSEFKIALAEKKQAFGKWLRRCEAGLDAAPKTAQLLTNTFFHVGEKRYDAVVTYEHLTFKMLERIDGHAASVATVQLFYPSPTLVNQHPVVMLGSDDLAEAQKISAVKWLNYLRSEAVQKRAIEYGFRPVNPKVSIREYDSEGNPFLKYRRYGVDFESPSVEAPRLDGETVFELVRTWEDATGRN